MNKELDQYLTSGFFTDSDHPSIVAYTEKITKGISSSKQKAIALYYAVRDGFYYHPYNIVLKHDALKASYLLTQKEGYCVQKSNLYAACVRAAGIPTRLGYGNVRNHLGTGKLEERLGTNILVFHGYTELFLDNKWVKATPVFNKSLCEKCNVSPLDFDGVNDSVFQMADKKGQPFMEYLHDYGTFSDVPFDLFVAELKKYYPHLFISGVLYFCN